MDEFLDDFLSPSSWPDMNTTGRSSWVDSTPGQTNGLLADPMGVFEAGEKNSTISMIPPSRIIGSLDGHTNDGSSAILVTGNSDYALDKRLFPGQTQQQQEALDHVPIPSQHTNEPHESEFSLQRVIENSSSAGSHSIASMPSIWPSSYTTVSSLSPILGQGKLEGLGLQGELADGDVNLLGKRYIRDDKIPPLDNMSVASGQDELHNSHLSSFAVGSQVALARSAGLQLDQQLSQCSDANSMKQYMNHSSVAQLQPAAATGGGCNGAVRPRVRARRGQATDPHSIAERLRREKIAERMKNLQELVPNSNKTDKASMLDEIIDYVKFLQLQVKVLSMSRLGAAGAVVPLITDVQSEGSGSLLLSASVGQGADLTQSQENVECEQEVVKLMESSVTTAMQFLQNKGLCLMPIALASAISGGKTPSNNGMTHGITSLSSNSSAAGLRASSSCSESPTKENAVKNESREDAVSSGCNGAVAAVKQEEVHKASCNIREVKPKA